MVTSAFFAGGRELKEWHKLARDRGITASKGVYFGYVAGVIDGLVAGNRKTTYFKIPPEVTVEDIVTVVDNYITRNFETIADDDSAASIVISALNEQWPSL